MRQLSTVLHQLCPHCLGSWAPGEALALRGLSQAVGWAEFLQWLLKAQQQGSGERASPGDGGHPRLTPGCQAVQRRNW